MNINWCVNAMNNIRFSTLWFNYVDLDDLIFPLFVATVVFDMVW